MAELLKQHEDRLEAITLVPSDGGTFEVSVDGKLVFSKLQKGRHAEDGEVAQLVRKAI
jgi:selenoprotein W-related protein